MENEIVVKKEFSIELLIEKAIDNEIPIESLEKLLAMRKELKEEFAREEYFRALSKFQSECPEIIKDKKVYDKTDLKKVRYSYASLDNIIKTSKQALKDYGFSHTFQPECTNKYVKVTTILHHIAGHSEKAEFIAEIDETAYMAKIQKSGNSLSYAKRYSFSAVTGLATTDEDNEQSLNEENKKSQKPQSKSEQSKPKEQEPIITEIVNPQEEEKVSYYKRLKLYAETNKIDFEVLSDYLKLKYKITKGSEVTEEIYNEITNNIATIEMLIKESIGGK